MYRDYGVCYVCGVKYSDSWPCINIVWVEGCHSIATGGEGGVSGGYN